MKMPFIYSAEIILHDQHVQNKEAVGVSTSVAAAYTITAKLFSAENAEQAYGKAVRYISGFNARPTSEKGVKALGIYQLSNVGLGVEKDGLQLESSMHEIYGERVSHVFLTQHAIPIAKEKKDLDAIRYEEMYSRS